MIRYKLCLPHKDVSDYSQPIDEAFDILHEHFAPGLYRSRERFAEVCSRSFTSEEAILVFQNILNIEEKEARRLFKLLTREEHIVWTENNDQILVIGHHATTSARPNRGPGFE